MRELWQLAGGNRNPSFAEATVQAGAETVEHFHRLAEEIYYFTSGAGRMPVGDQELDVRAGDTVPIPPGVRHKLWNPGGEPLVLVCASAPPYSNDDTVVCEAEVGTDADRADV